MCIIQAAFVQTFGSCGTQGSVGSTPRVLALDIDKVFCFWKSSGKFEYMRVRMPGSGMQERSTKGMPEGRNAGARPPRLHNRFLKWIRGGLINLGLNGTFQ